MNNNTLLIGEACLKNLWCMKATLRWFQLISSLKVIFYKINLIRVNVEDSFIISAYSFVKCEMGSVTPYFYYVFILLSLVSFYIFYLNNCGA